VVLRGQVDGWTDAIVLKRARRRRALASAFAAALAFAAAAGAPQLQKISQTQTCFCRQKAVLSVLLRNIRSPKTETKISVTKLSLI